MLPIPGGGLGGTRWGLLQIPFPYVPCKSKSVFFVVLSDLFYSSKIKSSLDLRAKREKAVGESIKALDDFKTRLQEEQKVIFFYKY